MINTINTATTGLESFSQGLSIISENVSNLNTVGYKQQRVSYFDLGDGDGNSAQTKPGDGVETGTPYRQFKQGEIRQSDNAIDAAIEGNGFFVVKDSNDRIMLTRAGQFQIGDDGVLRLRPFATLIAAQFASLRRSPTTTCHASVGRSDGTRMSSPSSTRF